MTLLQALHYFVREAFFNLVRSWKISVVAILTSAVSLYVGGGFLLVNDNLSGLLDRWQQQTRVVVYMDPGASGSVKEAIRSRIEKPSWVTGVTEVDAEEAQRRFEELFPNLTDVVGGGGEGTLPPSFEVSYDPGASRAPTFERWLEELRKTAGVSLVDDDRDWLRQLETLIAVVRGVGLTLGSVLLAAAVFTVASLIRLTAYLYQDDIAIMRLVGATEFFIRGPFYMEGLIQGILGGALAMLGLYLTFLAASHPASGSLASTLLANDFLQPSQVAWMVGVGGLAGAVGAVASLRREDLGATME